MRRLRLLISPSAAALVLGVGLAGAATQLPDRGGDREADVAMRAASSGRVAVRLVRSDAAGFELERLLPGDRGEGTLVIENDGDRTGTYALVPGTAKDIAGRLGGDLSRELELAVHDITDGEALLFAGRLGDLRDDLHLGEIAQGAKRRLRFRIDWEDGGEPASLTGGDNAYIGSKAEVLYEVRVTRPDDAPAAAPALVQSSAASRRGCVSRRRFGIRIRVPKGFKPVSTRVFVDGRRVRVLEGRRLRAIVDLRRMAPKRVKVDIAVRGANGRTIVGTRRYRTCVPKAPGTTRPPKL